jgi:YD repeat-containing protein
VGSIVTRRLFRSSPLLALSLIAFIGIAPVKAQTALYQYDGKGRLVSVTNPSGTVNTYTYDDTGSILRVTSTGTGNFALTSASPTAGKPGDPVTILGTGFTSSAQVAFNGVPATITALSATSITTTVPSTATTGPLTVAQGAQTLSAGAFSVLNGAPVLGAFSSPIAAPGSSVTLAGSNFNTASASGNLVTLNTSGPNVSGVNANVTEVTASQLKFVIPPISITPVTTAGSVGLTTAVNVETAGGKSITPKPLYLVPSIAFSALTNPGTTIPATPASLSSPGANALAFLNASPGNVNLTLSISKITGTGYLQIFIYGPDNTLKAFYTSPSFSNVVNNTFTGAIPIAVTAGVYTVQTFFYYNPSAGAQATGDVQFTFSGVTP